jgi:hypothetical protein
MSTHFSHHFRFARFLKIVTIDNTFRQDNKVVSLSHSIGLSCGAKGRVKVRSMLRLRILTLRDNTTFHAIKAQKLSKCKKKTIFLNKWFPYLRYMIIIK